MTSNEHKLKLEPAIALIINFRPFENKLVCNKQTFITITSSSYWYTNTTARTSECTDFFSKSTHIKVYIYIPFFYISITTIRKSVYNVNYQLNVYYICTTDITCKIDIIFSKNTVFLMK